MDQGPSRLPQDFEKTIEHALGLSRVTPGYLQDNEARFLGILAACTPGQGAIVEIGSFKGKSTVMIASVAGRYGLGPVVSIDPHEGITEVDPNSPEGQPTFEQFNSSLTSAHVKQNVEIHHAYSRDVAKGWERPIRLLWIDGDHSYPGCKEDFDLFSPFLIEGGIVALHDTLNAFAGPIRVFVEEVLRSDRFGPCGLIHSIAWGQFRPHDGNQFREARTILERRCARLIPFVSTGQALTGLRKIAYKLYRSRVPRSLVSPEAWLTSINLHKRST